MRANLALTKKIIATIICATSVVYPLCVSADDKDDKELNKHATAVEDEDAEEEEEENDKKEQDTKEYIQNVVLSEDTEGIERTPVRPTDVFNKEATVHAVVTTQDAPANTSYKASWYVVDVGQAATPNTLIDSVEVVTDGTRNIDFTLKPAAEWPVGSYRVDITVNGQVVTSKTYTIK